EDQVAVAREEVGLGGLVILAAAEAVGGQDGRDGRCWAGGVGDVEVVEDVAVLVSVGAEAGGARGLIGNLGIGRCAVGSRARRSGGQETSDQAHQPDYRSPRSFHRLFLPTAKASSDDRRRRIFLCQPVSSYRRLSVFPRDRGGLWREKREGFGVAEG